MPLFVFVVLLFVLDVLFVFDVLLFVLDVLLFVPGVTLPVLLLPLLPVFEVLDVTGDVLPPVVVPVALHHQQ